MKYSWKIEVHENSDRGTLRIGCPHNCGVPLIKTDNIEAHDKVRKPNWAWNGRDDGNNQNVRPSVWCHAKGCDVHFSIVNGVAIDH